MLKHETLDDLIKRSKGVSQIALPNESNKGASSESSDGHREYFVTHTSWDDILREAGGHPQGREPHARNDETKEVKTNRPRISLTAKCLIAAGIIIAVTLGVVFGAKAIKRQQKIDLINSGIVYYTKDGNRYHLYASCSNMVDPRVGEEHAFPLTDRTRCSKCYAGVMDVKRPRELSLRADFNDSGVKRFFNWAADRPGLSLLVSAIIATIISVRAVFRQHAKIDRCTIIPCVGLAVFGTAIGTVLISTLVGICAGRF